MKARINISVFTWILLLNNKGKLFLSFFLCINYKTPMIFFYGDENYLSTDL